MKFSIFILLCMPAILAIGTRHALAVQPEEYEKPEEPKVTWGDPTVPNLSAQPQPKYARVTEPTADETEPAGHDDLNRLVTYLTIFVLAVFVGVEVITKVPPTLHTPLMSGSNAISGITIVGAILAGQAAHATESSYLAGGLAFFAVIFAMINVVGGFVVTDRMLQMFRRKDRA